MSPSPDDAQPEDSVLADFDAGDVLDIISLGIIVIDSQLCAVYANTRAEELLAVRVENLRGRPLASFLPQPQPFLQAAERAFQYEEVVTFDLTGYAERSSDGTDVLDLRVMPLRNQLSARHLLLELRAAQPFTRR